MYFTKTTISVFLLTALLFCGSLSAQRVIPVPRQVEQQNGMFCITKDTKFYTNLKGEERERLIAYLSSPAFFFEQKSICGEPRRRKYDFPPKTPGVRRLF